MSKHENSDLDEGPPRRVDVQILIAHPTLAPADITAVLGLKPHVAHRAGDTVKTPDGILLDGKYYDTRWSRTIRYELRDQLFVDKVTMLVDSLVTHKAFLARLRATGGHATVTVQFLGDGYLGDVVPLDVLIKMADLQLDFGIECFAVPQA
jgi:hypothetical protein